MCHVSEPVSLESWHPTIAPLVYRRADGRQVAYLPSDHVSSWGNLSQPEGVEYRYRCTSPVVAMYLDLDQAHGHRINIPKEAELESTALTFSHPSAAISPLMPLLPRFPFQTTHDLNRHIWLHGSFVIWNRSDVIDDY